MKKSSKRPPNARVINDYATLLQYVTGFFVKFNLLILIGPPGTQKSRVVRQALGSDKVLFLEGRVTPFQAYVELYKNRDLLVCIDDTEGLCGDRIGRCLLKSLCSTEETKKLSWQSAARGLQEQGIPRSFVTRSRVVLIGNEWQIFNKHIGAIEDRGHLVFFEPSAEEVHRRTTLWFQDEEITEFMQNHLHLIHRHSMRHYVHAAELKAAGMQWQDEMLHRLLPNPRMALVAILQADASFCTEEERAMAFVERGGGHRATYFRYAARLRSNKSRLRISG